MPESLAGLGEAELIRRIAHFAPAGQLSDDTACLTPDPRPLLLNTDVLVDGVHFSDITTPAVDVGWRAVAANLSDLAASGAEHIDGITVALVAPGNTPWTWVEGVYQGITAALNQFGGSVLGGDCSSGQQRLLSITALGRLGRLRLHRSDAQPGDALVTSGPHGLSRLGLALLQNDPSLNHSALSETLQQRSIERHQRPIPRFDALQTLLQCKPTELPWRVGGTDSSDGLLAAVQALCSSSNCGAILQEEHLPRHRDWPKGNRWRDWCLAGGEDFELVLSLPADWASAWLQILPDSCHIGTMTNNPGKITWEETQLPLKTVGYDHYKSITT
ncbi:MAG: thiamine-phosphate kinase [Cyanobium sp. NAT70]|nr:thiamine-phosphate kinase [Cyanobium sp. NAT70]